MSLTLVLAGIVLFALSGLPAMLVRRAAGEWTSAIVAVAGSLAGLAGAVPVLRDRLELEARMAWQLPGAELVVRIDPLAAAFLLPIFVLGALASVYGIAYWPAREQRSAGSVRFFIGLLLAGMSTVVIAAHGMLFLVAWEIMAIAAFFLIAANDEEEGVRQAAWSYLIATHVGTLALFALFVLLRSERGTFILGPVPQSTGLVTASILFLLALAGFGFKAGVVPLHFWLPGAHANAPSHVSALLSGAMLKVGIYGLIRVALWLPHPPAWWGTLLVVLGLTSALTGITLAIGQSDLKRVLAYSSIENIGIITTAIGFSMLGRAHDQPVVAAIGIAAAIAHVWNHSLFKGLLFFGAGSLLHATGTRRIESLGGLLRRMPRTGTAIFIGALAAAAIPGSNAFVSEAILYFGLLGSAVNGSVVALAAAVIALVGALAVACFVRLVGIVLLGEPRTEAAARAHESPMLMTAPAWILAVGCVALGIMPPIVTTPLETLSGVPDSIGPFLNAAALPIAFAALVAILTAVAVVVSTRRSPRALTWDCGYARPTARMQYTGASFGEWFTTLLAPPFLRPRKAIVRPRDLYPDNASYASMIDEPFEQRLYEPAARHAARRILKIRWMQQGRLSLYLLYVFATLLAGLVWAVVAPFIRGMQ